MSSITDLSAQQLRHAAEIKEKIQLLEDELNRILNPPHAVSTTAGKPKRKMRSAARARIAAAQKARWAKLKRTKSTIDTARKPTRKMSAAARAKISAAAKARWAKVKTAKK